MPKTATRPRASRAAIEMAERLYGRPYDEVRAELGKKKPSDVYRAAYGASGPYAHRIAQFAYLAGDVPFPPPERVASISEAVAGRLSAALRAVPTGKAPFDARLGEALLEMGDEEGARIIAHAIHALAIKSGAKRMVEDPAEAPPQGEGEAEGELRCAPAASASTSATGGAGAAARAKKYESCPRFRALLERWSNADARALYSHLDERTRGMRPEEYASFYSRVVASERRKGPVLEDLRAWLGVQRLPESECETIELVARQHVAARARELRGTVGAASG